MNNNKPQVIFDKLEYMTYTGSQWRYTSKKDVRYVEREDITEEVVRI